MTSSVDLPSLFQPSPAAVSVIDPELKLLGRLWLPLPKLLPTNGLTRHQSGHPYPLSLCLLYQKQRCHAGEQCNQVHADRGFVSSFRAVLQSVPFSNCCHQHGDLHSTRRDFQGLCEAMRVRFVSGDGVTQFPIAAGEIAVTAFWNKWMTEPGKNTNACQDTEMVLSLADLCIHHLRSGCKNGVDCKHVHVCRAAFAKIAVKLGHHASHSNTTPAPGTAMASASFLPTSTSTVVSMPQPVQPVLREQVMGKCLSGAPRVPAAVAAEKKKTKTAEFVPLTSWRKDNNAAATATLDTATSKPEIVERKVVDQVIPTSSVSASAAVAPALALASPRPAPKPLCLSLPLPLEPKHVVPGAGEGMEEAISPTTGESIARHLIAMSDDWGEPSKCEEEVEKALQHERPAWMGRRAGSSRLPTWGSSLASPVRV